MPSLLVDMMWWGAQPNSLWTPSNAVIPAGQINQPQYSQTPVKPSTSPNYPDTENQGLWAVLTVQGPASYQKLQTVVPMIGGQLLTVAPTKGGSAFGSMSDLDFVHEGCSDDGQYEAIPFMERNPVTGANAVRLMWISTTTGLEVLTGTNLSARTVRLLAMGR